MTSVLKQYVYRGCPVYIRFLGGRSYETLIVFRNRIHVYQVNVMKPRKQDKRVSLQEMHDGVMGELMNASAQLIENFKKERKVVNVLKTNLQQLHGKTAKIIGGWRASGGISGWFGALRASGQDRRQENPENGIASKASDILE